MERPDELEIKLLEFIDGTLNEKEKKQFEQILLENPALQQRLKQLKSVDSLLRKGADADLPSRNFTLKVMDNLFNNPRPQLSLLNGILLLSGVILVVGICTILLSAGFFDSKTTLDLNQVAVLKKYIPTSLPSVGLDGNLLINGIILLNLAIGFIVLDRAVLKPFFQRRTHAGT